MLQLSGLVINLSNSKDYLLLLIVVNTMVVLLALGAEVELKYVFLITSILLWQIIKHLKIGKPHPEIHSIIFTGKDWVLKANDGNLQTYTKLKIRLDSGFFAVVTFYTVVNSKKSLVIFNDQMAATQLKHLYILAKLMP